MAEKTKGRRDLEAMCAEYDLVERNVGLRGISDDAFGLADTSTAYAVLILAHEIRLASKRIAAAFGKSKSEK